MILSPRSFHQNVQRVSQRIKYADVIPKRHLLINRVLAEVRVRRILSQDPSICYVARLSPGLSLGGSAADALSLRALQVGCRDPALIVRLCAGRDSWAISADNGNLVSGVDLLGALGRLLRALSALAATLLLGEEGGDPRVVDKVGDSTEDSEDDEV
jgi:hypothetical protein